MCLVLLACGQPLVQHPAPALGQVFASAPELLELESLGTRQELFREVARTSRGQTRGAGQGQGLVLFPLWQDGEFHAAPGVDSRLDLLQGSDGGAVANFIFDVRTGDRWPEERRDSLQGLSEREVAELVARSLVASWHVHTHGSVQVERAAGVPYAAAYVDGVLRINPAFLYLAAAASGS